MLLDNAQDLVEKKIPKPSRTDREQALVLGTDREIRLGWCEIQNAGSRKEDVELIRNGYAADRIKIRMYNAVYGPGEDANRLIASVEDHRQDADATLSRSIDEYDHHFTQRTIKVIFDGALGSRGAALLKPYHDQPNTSGYLREKPEELRPMFEQHRLNAPRKTSPASPDRPRERLGKPLIRASRMEIRNTAKRP